jgi:hypothetical protein
MSTFQVWKSVGFVACSYEKWDRTGILDGRVEQRRWRQAWSIVKAPYPPLPNKTTSPLAATRF